MQTTAALFLRKADLVYVPARRPITLQATIAHPERSIKERLESVEALVFDIKAHLIAQDALFTVIVPLCG